MALAFGVLLQARASVRAQSTDAGSDDYINPDRPGIADGSNVIGTGHFQIETGIQQTYHHGDGGYTWTFYIPTLLRLGTSSNLERLLSGSGVMDVGGAFGGYLV